MVDLSNTVRPAFRAAIEAAARTLAHEGAIATENGEELFEATHNGTRLQMTVRRGKILRAAHQGGEHPAQRAVLDALCDAMEGLPVQEAADHAGHHVVARLRDPDAPAPVAGILTPGNADQVFRIPIQLLRAAHADYRARHDVSSVENFWNPTISKDWLRLDQAAQVARLEPILAAFLADRGMAAEDASLIGVEGGIRVLVAFADDVGYQLKPGLLMAFESKLRAETGDRLEVFSEEMKDANRIRRL